MSRLVVIAGGGTGGHLYPALVVGRRLREKDPAVELLFVGGRREIERKIMEDHGAAFVPLAVEGIKGRGLRAVRAAARIPFALLRSRRLLRRTKPALVIGAGGYSSGPVVLAAARMGIPTLLLEQNVRPGLTNRLLARRADRAVVAFEASLAWFGGKGVLLGNPVRDEFYGIAPKPWTGRLSLLVFGGSQGSRFLNDSMCAALPLLRPRAAGLEIVHQTGTADLERVARAYREAGFEQAEIKPYLQDMAARFTRADLVLARAGATTIAELVAARRPAVLVPFAGAADNHQELNAREIEKAGGAAVLRESEASSEALAALVLGFLDRPERLAGMAAGLASLRRESPAGAIADLALNLMTTSTTGSRP